MLRSLFLLSMLCVGCAPTTPANDASDAVRTIFQASLPWTVARGELRRTACSLAPIVPVGGERRAVAVWVDARPCDASKNAHTLRLDVSHRRNDDAILLEMSVPPGSGPDEVADVARGLGEIRAELEARTRGSEKSGSRASQKMLGVSIVLGSIALLAGATGAITLGIGVNAQPGGDGGILAAGGAVLGIGAAPTFLASMITALIASRSEQQGN